MSGQSNEDKKPDFSNLPRGAISIKGLPVNRNARLPSIRTPRDLTLGSQPKRTFLPNIPVRREKRVADTEKTPLQPQSQNSSRNSLQKEQGRGSGRKKDSGREKAVIIQTEGSVFGEGIAADAAAHKERQKDSYQSYGRTGTSAGIALKKEQGNAELSRVTSDLNNILRDDFIDDPDEVEDKLKPVIFPNDIKYEESLRKKEEIKEDFQKSVKPTFDPEVAKNMGFDVEKVAKFIKKEKGVEEVRESLESFAQLPDDEIFKRLNLSQSELMLLQFPSCVTVPDSNADLDNAPSQRSHQNGESNLSDEQKKISTYLSSLSEGHIGKLQLLKSGKIRLILGALKFDLDSITPLISKHEVVSVRTNNGAGEMVTLGSMEQKIIFDPDVESFF